MVWIVLRVIGRLFWNALRGGVAYGVVLSAVLTLATTVGHDDLGNSLLQTLMFFGGMSVLFSLLLTIIPALLLVGLTLYGLHRWDESIYQIRMQYGAVIGLLIGHAITLLILPELIVMVVVPAFIGVIAIYWSAGMAAHDVLSTYRDQRISLSVQN